MELWGTDYKGPKNRQTIKALEIKKYKNLKILNLYEYG